MKMVKSPLNLPRFARPLFQTPGAGGAGSHGGGGSATGWHSRAQRAADAGPVETQKSTTFDG